jgi:hypothetical protein
MIQLTSVQLQEAATAYVTANTPFFFFDRLRNSETAAILAQQHTSESIFQAIRAVNATEPTEAERILLIFAMVAALTRTRTPVSATIFDDIDLSRYRWGEDFCRFAKNYANTDNRLDIQIMPKFSYAPYASESTTNNRIALSYGS